MKNRLVELFEDPSSLKKIMEKYLKHESGLFRLFTKYEYSAIGEKIIEVNREIYSLPQRELCYDYSEVDERALDYQLNKSDKKALYQERVGFALAKNVKKLYQDLEEQAVNALWVGNRYNRNPENTIIPDVSWSDSVADIMEDLKKMAQQIVKNGGHPHTLIVGYEAYSAIFNNPKIADMLHKNMQYYSHEPREIYDIGHYVTKISIGGFPLSFYLYNKRYYDENKEEQSFLDPHAVIMLGTHQDSLITCSGKAKFHGAQFLLNLDNLPLTAGMYDSPPHQWKIYLGFKALLVVNHPNHITVLNANGGAIT